MIVTIKVDTRKIKDWETFHTVFAKAFGFPRTYGRNFDAWIDCMTYLNDPKAGMTKKHTPPGGVVTMLLEGVDDFSKRCPEIFKAIVDGTAFVNWRHLEKKEGPVLTIAYEHG